MDDMDGTPVNSTAHVVHGVNKVNKVNTPPRLVVALSAG